MTDSLTDAWSILVAGGKGTRMRGPLPKQFRQLAGIPLYLFGVHSLLASGVKRVVLVVPESFVERVLKETSGLATQITVTVGGERRRDSVAAGLRLIPSDVATVVIHDAVRPFLPASLMRSVTRAAVFHRAALPVLPLADTLKKSEEGEEVLCTLDRKGLFLAQTPQAFSRDLLSEIVSLDTLNVELTDEAMGAERLGVRPRMVQGSPFCFKITTEEDLMIAEAVADWLRRRESDDENWAWIRHTSAR